MLVPTADVTTQPKSHRHRPPDPPPPMKCFALAALLALACAPATPTERHGFITRLGRDTISVESVTRRGNTVTSDAVDRFPRVRRRHTEIALRPDGGIERLV